jgi:hypothetical protein
MRRALLWLIALVVSCFPVSAATPEKAVSFSSAHDLAGWKLVTSTASDLASVCHVSADGIIAVAGKPVGYLELPGNFTDFRMHFEWRWPADASIKSNSGVLLHIASGPIDRGTWPRCFQVQTKISRAGDLLPMAGATFAEPLSTPPNAKTPLLDRSSPPNEKPLGEWNSCDVLCRDGSIDVVINGVHQNHVSRCAPASGRIGFQLEGFPYELRKVELARIPDRLEPP